MTNHKSSMGNENKMETRYMEVDLNVVMNYFVAGFKLREGEVSQADWFVDIGKSRVMFKLYVKQDVAESPPAAPADDEKTT